MFELGTQIKAYKKEASHIKENKQSDATFNHSQFNTEIMVNYTKLFYITARFSRISFIHNRIIDIDCPVRVLSVFSDGELFELRTHRGSRTSILSRTLLANDSETSVAMISLCTLYCVRLGSDRTPNNLHAAKTRQQIFPQQSIPPGAPNG